MRVSTFCFYLLLGLGSALVNAQEQRAIGSQTANPRILPRADAPLLAPAYAELSTAQTAPIDVQTLHLAMDPTDAEVLFRKEPHDDSEFSVAVMEGGQRMPGTIEVKGSFTRNFIKKSILIKLEKGQLWHGYRKISLNGMSTDPTNMREWQAWNLVDHLGMAHPAVKYTRLYINDRYIGLFLFIEWIEPSLFARYGVGDDGEFYHPVDNKFCGDFLPKNNTRLPDCWYKLAPHDNDYSKLRELVEAIDAAPMEQFDQFMDKHFDVDSVINWILVNTLVSSTDTYNKNFFLYYSKQKQKWLVVPWDYDLTFGRGADYALPFPKSILNDNFHYYYSAESGNPNPLIEKTLSNPSLFKRFRAHLRHTFGLRREAGVPDAAFGWFAPAVFRAQLAQLVTVVAPEIEQDYYKPVKPEEFWRHVDTFEFYNLMRYHFLKYQVLMPSVFNTPRWMPFHSYPEFAADEIVEPAFTSPYPVIAADPPNRPEPIIRTYQPLVLAASANLQPDQNRAVLVDEQLARPLGVLNIVSLDRPARVRLEVEMERQPVALPPGISDPEKCIQRNWYLDLKTHDAHLELSVVLDYLQEHTYHHERGALINDDNEHQLQLWAHQDDTWTPVIAVKNTLANALASKTLRIAPGQVIHFAACLPATPPASN
jgi:hypothetical protein